jgi:hypothetical protein
VEINEYRILVATAGVTERILAANILSQFSLREEQHRGDFSLDLRYEALTKDTAESLFAPRFFVGAVLATRGSDSQLAIRTFASRADQSQRASIHETEAEVDVEDVAAHFAACCEIVDALFDQPGGIVWQSRYDTLVRQAVNEDRKALDTVLRMLQELPEHMRAPLSPDR